MAESNPARLDHRTPLARAEVNVITHGTAPAAHQFDRADPVTHYPLGFVQPRSEPRPAPPPPTEQELRAKLAQALERMDAADSALDDARGAHEQAQTHLQTCQRRAGEFATLDVEVGAATTSALRAGKDVADVRDAFAEKLDQKASAAVELKAAQAAVTTLLAEMESASARAGNATREVDTLVAKVLAFPAEAMAREVLECRGQIDRRVSCLLGFDKLTVSTKQFLAPTARYVVGDNVSPQQVFRANMKPWADAAAALRADPQVAITIELPRLEVPTVPGTSLISYGPPQPYAKPEAPAAPPPQMDDGDPHVVGEEQAQ
jgi:hypothetical protein